MHWLCLLIGHRYNVSHDYDDRANQLVFIHRACTRCGKLLTSPMPSAQKSTEVTATQKTRKPRATKTATTNL